MRRKKITVRRKRGKTYQRSVLVRASKPTTKRSGLHSLNPWEQHHTEHANKNSALPADRAKLYGSSGPGSSHSWLALAVGASKQREQARRESSNPFADFGTAEHASARRWAGVRTSDQSRELDHYMSRSAALETAHSTGSRVREWREGLHSRYGGTNIHEVHQDPRKWVRE